MKESISQLPVEQISLRQINFYLKWMSLHTSGESTEAPEPKYFGDIFNSSEITAICGLRLPPGRNLKGYLGDKETLDALEQNIIKLRDSGIDGVVLENYSDSPRRTFCDTREELDYYLLIAQKAKEFSHGRFKLGINLILFDIYGALSVAKLAGLDFIITDEFVNKIICTEEETHLDHPFTFNPCPRIASDYYKDIKAQGVAILAGTHSNYYPTVDKTISFNQSVKNAWNNSAAAVVMGKNNRLLYNSNHPHPIPILVSGGVKDEDLAWIKKEHFGGFSAGSLFEESFGSVSEHKVASVLHKINCNGVNAIVFNAKKRFRLHPRFKNRGFRLRFAIKK